MSGEWRSLDYCRLLYNVSRQEKRTRNVHPGDFRIVILRSKRGTRSKHSNDGIRNYHCDDY